MPRKMFRIRIPSVVHPGTGASRIVWITDTVLTTEMNSATDNPPIFPDLDQVVLREIFTSAVARPGFLSIAIAELAE
jgi:histidine ammonia-lyase